VIRAGGELRAAACAAAIAGLLPGATALAQTRRTVVLIYARHAGAEACPNEQALRRAVIDRLGYDPFRPDAAAAVTASITRVRGGFRADVTLGDGNGNVEGMREMSSREDDCVELAEAMALAISIAVDPMGAPLPAAPLEPSAAPGAAGSDAAPGAARVTPAAAPDRDMRPVPAASRALREPLALRAAVGPVLGFGTAPGTSAGLALQLGGRRGWSSLGLEGRADLPVSEPAAAGGSVEASLLLLSIVPCAHRGLLLVCALGSLGSLRGMAEGPGGHPERTIFGSAGVRAGVEIPLDTTLSARLAGDVGATLTPTTLYLNGEEVWSTPPLSAALGLAVQADFP
jgi:hypothetical protein